MQRVNCSCHYFYSNLQCTMPGFGGVCAVSDVGNGPTFDTVRLIEAAWTRANVIPRPVDSRSRGGQWCSLRPCLDVTLSLASLSIYVQGRSQCACRLHHERSGLCLRPPSQIKVTLPPFPTKIHLQNASPSARGRAAPSARFLIQSCGYIHTHETSTTVS